MEYFLCLKHFLISRRQEFARGLEDSFSPVVVSEEEQPPDPLRVPLTAQRVLQVPEGRGGAHDPERGLHCRAD